MKATLTRGDQLAPLTQRRVLGLFVHRWTHENVGVEGAYPPGHTPTIPKVSDDEWLAAHAFYVKADGTLDERYSHCEPHYLASSE